LNEQDNSAFSKLQSSVSKLPCSQFSINAPVKPLEMVYTCDKKAPSGAFLEKFSLLQSKNTREKTCIFSGKGQEVREDCSVDCA
jgi:hypothetical protein